MVSVRVICSSCSFSFFLRNSNFSYTCTFTTVYCSCMLQTPAERVRAKLKMMLDKTSDKLSKESSSEEQTTMTFAPPSAADIAKIEGDSFEPASFVSHRAAKKVERESIVIHVCISFGFIRTGCPIWSGWS